MLDEEASLEENSSWPFRPNLQSLQNYRQVLANFLENFRQVAGGAKAGEVRYPDFAPRMRGGWREGGVLDAASFFLVRLRTPKIAC